MLTLALLLFPSVHAAAQSVNPPLWGTDGLVTAVVRSGNTIYVGGVFDRVAPVTGGGALFSTSDGTLVPSFPKVLGGLSCAVPDGSGGWFVGGRFSAIGGVPRQNLAHVLADGRIGDWAPYASRPVIALARRGRTIYVSGLFATIGGKARQYLASVDAITGETTDWNPNPNGPIGVFELKGDILYVGGSFTSICGERRHNIAAIDLNTGRARPWSPYVNDAVNAILAEGTTVYVGGGFTRVDGQPRNCVAALDARTGAVTAWNPDATSPFDWFDSAYVSGLSRHGGTIYIAGHFTTVGGTLRKGLAAVDAGSGTLTDWDPLQGQHLRSAFFLSVAVACNTVYVAGDFQMMIGGQPRRNAAAVDARTGLALPWDPGVDVNARILALSPQSIMLGGPFLIAGGEARCGLAALDASTGALLSWNPQVEGLGVFALAVSGQTLYFGGEFRKVGGLSRDNIAAVDVASGQPTPWNPRAFGDVLSLAVRSGLVYAGGRFGTIGGLYRNYVAALDSATGLATSWNPDPNDEVTTLVATDQMIYAGGLFGRIGGQTRSRAAALDPVTGAATAWDPAVHSWGWVNSLALAGNTMYIGGTFVSVGGEPRNNIAAVDATSGLPLPWNPDASGQVMTVATDGRNVYIGGFCGNVGGEQRDGLAAVDGISGAVLDWHPVSASSGIWALSCAEGIVYVGGAFEAVGGVPQHNVAAITAPLAGSRIAAVAGLEPSGSSVTQCSPNPVRSNALIRFSTAVDGTATLVVYDLQGRRMAVPLNHERIPAGAHEAVVRTAGWPAGWYVYRLEAGQTTATRKFLVIR